MVEIGDNGVEQQISLYDGLEFVSKQDVAPGDSNTPAYTLEGPDGYVIGIDASTPVAPEFRDVNGDKLDSSTRVTIQKCDRQGNPIGSAIVFNDLIGRFSYPDMRNDPDFFRKTNKSLMVDEREIVKVFVDVPSGAANGFDAAQSQITIGDDTSDFGKAVEIMEHDSLSGAESDAVKKASQRGSGGN